MPNPDDNAPVDPSQGKSDVPDPEVVDGPDEHARVQSPKELMEQFFAGFTMQSFGPVPNQLVEKLQPEHITKIIDNYDAHNQREYETAKGNRRALLLVLSGAAVFMLLISVLFVLTNRDALLQTVLGLVVGLIGGFGAGYGLPRLLQHRDD